MLINKIIKRIFRMITAPLDLFLVLPPFEFVQTITEQSIHKFLKINTSDVKTWVIVGGYLGLEIPRILRRYPNCNIHVFECSHRYIQKLKKRFDKNPRVHIYEMAVSNTTGSMTFYETNLRGSGSLLRVGELAKDIYGMSQAEEFTVQTTTLDESLAQVKVDVLQLDVQGAEMDVLKGAHKTLKHTRALLTEVAMIPNLYQNSVVFDDLNYFLSDAGFTLCLLGNDHNLTGNALFVREEEES